MLPATMSADALSCRDLSPEETTALLDAIQSLSYPHALDEVMRAVLSAARRLTAADGVTFVLREGDQVFYADEDAIGPLWKGRRFKASECISGWCMLHRETVVIEDIYADARIPHDAYLPTFVKSVAMVPIRTIGPLGAIGAYWAERHHASRKEIFILETLANVTAGAVANAELYRKLHEANQAKDEFLAMLGHELRNPIAPILTAVHLLRLRGPSTIEKERAVIERQVTHLIRLVDDLLDVSRIARGKVELKREPLEIAEVVGNAIEMVSPLFEQKCQHLTVSVPQSGLAVLGDPMRLAQVVSNLLTNAAKYTEPGGHVTVSATREWDRVSIRVRDDGIGIEPKMLARIFDLFVQDHQALDRSQGGLGLGLAIVRGLVVQHGGSVSVHSDGPGRGAEFNVTLPLIDSRAVRPTPTPELEASSSTSTRRRHRVLVVDDNADAADLLATAIRAAGYETKVAHDGPSALSIAAAFRADVAILDIGLPVMDGYELAARLRQLSSSTELRLLAVTGYGQESDRKRSQAAGFDRHFVKPVDVDELLLALRSLSSTIVDAPRATRAQA